MFFFELVDVCGDLCSNLTMLAKPERARFTGVRVRGKAKIAFRELA